MPGGESKVEGISLPESRYQGELEDGQKWNPEVYAGPIATSTIGNSNGARAYLPVDRGCFFLNSLAAAT